MKPPKRNRVWAALLMLAQHYRRSCHGCEAPSPINVLVKLFQKLARVTGAKPLSRSAEREIILGISFLRTFFFVPLVSKKKVANDFPCVRSYSHFLLQNSLPAFSLDDIGAREKAWQKEKRRKGSFALCGARQGLLALDPASF